VEIFEVEIFFGFGL